MKHRGHQTVKKGCRPQKQHKSRKRMARYRFFSLYFFKTRLALAWSVFLLSASCASYRINRQSNSSTVVFSARPRSNRHCYPPLAMRQACLGRVPRRSSARLAENLRSETRRFFRLEGRRTPPYRCMARDETNQTGKYSVSGTMLPESLCPGLQRRTPCPCSLSDSLRACQNIVFDTLNAPCVKHRGRS